VVDRPARQDGGRGAEAQARPAADGARTAGRPVELHDAELLGARIRRWRQDRGLSVRALAERVNVTGGFISQVERGLASPSVGSLYRLAAALEVPVEAIFREDPAESTDGIESAPLARDGAASLGHVVRARERRHLDLSDGMHWAKLSPDEESPHEFLEIVMEVGASTGPVPLRHGGREYAVILEGEARFEIGFQSYTLQAGDSITFDSSIPHRTVNVGDRPVRGIHFMLDCNVLSTLAPRHTIDARRRSRS
jgi:transcriptional regulator with XRE-family HTH domain